MWYAMAGFASFLLAWSKGLISNTIALEMLFLCLSMGCVLLFMALACEDLK